MAKDDALGLLGEALTPEEQKYLDSRGETELPPEPPAPAPEPPVAPKAETAPASTPAPEPTPPEEEEDDTPEPIDPKTGKQPPRRVPYRKFKALEDQLTSKNQEFETTRARVQELEQTMARADERMRIINEALAEPSPAQAQAEEEDPRPDPREDVFAYMEWQERQTGRLFERFNEQIEGLSNRQEEADQYAQVSSEQAQLENQYRRDAGAYAATNTKFVPAYTYLMNMRDRQYTTLGIRDPNERMARIVNEEREIMHSAYAERVNPAQRIYELALASGFNPDAAPAVAGNGAPAAGSSAPAAAAAPASAPAAHAGAAPNVAAEIEAVRRGQAAAQSLSHGGGVPPDQLTPDMLGNMSDEDFQHVMNRLSKSRQRELLGG
jgi:hypothetical protein